MAEKESKLGADAWELLRMNIELYDGFQDAELWTKFLIQVGMTFGELPLVRIEEHLRSRKSNTWLLAVPVEYLPGGIGASLPHDLESWLPYFLVTEVRGEDEARMELESMGVSWEENLENLAECGLVAPIPGSVVAQQMRADLN